MKQGYLSQYFEQIVFKIIVAGETVSDVSHQHEFNGNKALKALFGKPVGKTYYPASIVYLTDDEDNPVKEDVTLTWYDARENQPLRSAEPRLYYSPNTIMQLAEEGDLLFIGKTINNGAFLSIIAEKNTTIAAQLQWLFGIGGQINPSFSIRSDLETENDRLDFAASFILEQIGININTNEEQYLDVMLKRFDGNFPTTGEFSSFARSTLPDINCLHSPDSALTAWMEREEILFRTLEKHLLANGLQSLIPKDDKKPDTDAFMQLAMSTLQRRKARAGSALENHLEEIFQKFSIPYTRNGITEQKHKPDFIFPGIDQYRDPKFPVTSLTMLGAKSTCKDRWRQILTEADRISEKHLFTLEPSISENQTNEMQQEKVTLVLPESLRQTYTNHQQSMLMTLSDFISFVRCKS